MRTPGSGDRQPVGGRSEDNDLPRATAEGVRERIQAHRARALDDDVVRRHEAACPLEPALIARAANADDVQTAVRYAIDKNIPIAVRSGEQALTPHSLPNSYINLKPYSGPDSVPPIIGSPEKWQRIVNLKRTWDPSNHLRYNKNIVP